MQTGGYDGIVTYLASTFPAGTIKLNNVVKSVAYDAAGVTVTTEKGVVYKADYVVVTLPIGVLKASSVSFTPELPSSKYTALDKIAMGVLDKVRLACI